jgi:NTP pyrophosphatase (non-canonical NTP hydrolase)
MSALADILAERAGARDTYGPFTSTHEALGVLCEEWDELREAIHRNALAAIYREAVQVAAVALRLAEQADAALWAGEPTPFSTRSGISPLTWAFQPRE